jgi:hypothetical protein
VFFKAQAPLPPGKRVELSISWPDQLDGKCGLRLVARGRIVRCEGTNVALEISKHEFRTASRGLGDATRNLIAPRPPGNTRSQAANANSDIPCGPAWPHKPRHALVLLPS